MSALPFNFVHYGGGLPDEGSAAEHDTWVSAGRLKDYQILVALWSLLETVNPQSFHSSEFRAHQARREWRVLQDVLGDAAVAGRP